MRFISDTRYSLNARDVRSGSSITDVATSLDHFVYTQQERLRDFQAEGPRRREIEDQLKPRRLFDRSFEAKTDPRRGKTSAENLRAL